jgi:hypothetical protein
MFSQAGQPGSEVVELSQDTDSAADVHCLRKLHTLPVHDQTTDPIDHNTLMTRAPFGTRCR